MSPYLYRTRRIWVYLPPDYDPDREEGYQVIYLTSAQNLFGQQAESNPEPNNDWGFDETLDSLYYQTGKGTIAVGLEYDFHYPWDEYTLWNNNNMDNWVTDVTVLTGKGTSYLIFIVNTLKPIIDTSYNTLPDRENTAIGGGSRHALFALCAGLMHHNTFSKVMAMSPAVWLAEGGSRLPLGKPTWFTTNQLGVWLDKNVTPPDVEFFLHIGTNEEQGTGGNFPYAYTDPTDPETKLEWKDVYLRGAIKIEKKLDLDGEHYHVTNEGHLPSVWGEYGDDALQVLGFYP
ncbi:MAG: alpha/beta hydrolase-fold protein [Bacteroidota bacterium]|nr:alpha/beta hydrolase-fold protein [Bacteroidota bacterium]